MTAPPKWVLNESERVARRLLSRTKAVRRACAARNVFSA